MKKLKILLISAVILLNFTDYNTIIAASGGERAKYVFLFIGDGMGLAHIAATEAYLAAQKGIIGSESLNFTKFPQVGLLTTHSSNHFITCSSAAGTAMATGVKTKNYMLGVDSDTNKLRAITYKIKDRGYKVALLTTVSVDQATPAAFYASSAKRSDYYGIATQMPESGFDFFGGGGFAEPKGKNGDKESVYDLAEGAGYKVVYDTAAANRERGSKLLLVQKSGKAELPLAIDRTKEDITLKQLVESAIKNVDNKRGFFIMAEGGQIDWTAHSNDAKSTILEIIDMADAVNAAYEFYLKHPKETLIIVTADHETGGLSIGKDSGYNINMKALDKQESSVSRTPEKKGEIAKLNTSAQLGWTTRSHTGIMVPLFAIGAGSSSFAGKMDNTELPRKICAAMGITF